MKQFILMLISISYLCIPNSNAQILQSNPDTLAPQVFEQTTIQVAEPSPTILMENSSNDNGIVIDPSQLQLVTHWVDGRVVDNNYQTLRDASVYFKDKATGDIFRTKTDQNGNYKYQLADGEYDVTVEAYPYKQTRTYSISISNSEEHMEDIEMLKKINVTVYLQDERNNRAIRDGELVCYQNGKAYYFQKSNTKPKAVELMLFPGKYDFKLNSSTFKIAKADYSQIINRNNHELIFKLVSNKKVFALDFTQLKPQNYGYTFQDMKKYHGQTGMAKRYFWEDELTFHDYFTENFYGKINKEGQFYSEHQTTFAMALYTAPLNLPDGSTITELDANTEGRFGALSFEIIRKHRSGHRADEKIAKVSDYNGDGAKTNFNTKLIKEAIINNNEYDYFINVYISKDIEKWDALFFKYQREYRTVYLNNLKIYYY